MELLGGAGFGLVVGASEVSLSAAAALASGAVVVTFILGSFLAHERYRRPPKSLSPVEFADARCEAGELIVGLAPRAMLLAEAEKAAARAAEGRVQLECAAATGFREGFAAASAPVEEDPEGAIRELRRLPALLETSLERVNRVAGLLSGGPAVGVRTGLAGRSREDG